MGKAYPPIPTYQICIRARYLYKHPPSLFLFSLFVHDDVESRKQTLPVY